MSSSAQTCLLTWSSCKPCWQSILAASNEDTNAGSQDFPDCFQYFKYQTVSVFKITLDLPEATASGHVTEGMPVVRHLCVCDFLPCSFLWASWWYYLTFQAKREKRHLRRSGHSLSHPSSRGCKPWAWKAAFEVVPQLCLWINGPGFLPERLQLCGRLAVLYGGNFGANWMRRVLTRSGQVFFHSNK